MERRALLQ